MPSTRRGRRIDRCLSLGNRYRPRGNDRPRCVAPRQGEAFVELSEIRESGDETDHEDLILPLRVNLDDIRGAQAGATGDLLQVGTVVRHRNGVVRGFDRSHRGFMFENVTESFAKLVECDYSRIVMNSHSCICRNDVRDTDDRGDLDLESPGDYARGELLAHPIAEGNRDECVAERRQDRETQANDRMVKPAFSRAARAAVTIEAAFLLSL